MRRIAEPLTIGWVGTGVMGAPMAGHLLAAGHALRVSTRTRARAEDLVEQGAQWCATPAAAAEGADVVCTMVGYPADVREVVLGEDGVLGALGDGGLLIDFTTSSPGLAEEIHAAAAERGAEALDAPVSGGDVGARNGTLVVMAGGSEAAFARAQPVFDAVGERIVHCGPPGAGQHTKMMNQVAIAAGMIAVCEALLYAQRAGLDLERAVETIGGGAAGSWSLANYGPRILKGDLEPGFKVDHFVKDLGLALEEARRMRLSLPGTALAEQLYVAAQGRDLGQKGTQSLIAVLAGLSGEDWALSAPR
jgi:3-hydroxyisobutyrate dehydrogenase